MFFPVSNTTGTVIPFEEYPAAAGVYKPGMLLGFNAGLVAPAAEQNGMPPFLCVCHATLKEGDTITVVPVSKNMTYRCNEMENEPQVGSYCAVTSTGVKYADDEGGFLITAILSDGVCEGRFV